MISAAESSLRSKSRIMQDSKSKVSMELGPSPIFHQGQETQEWY